MDKSKLAKAASIASNGPILLQLAKSLPPLAFAVWLGAWVLTQYNVLSSQTVSNSNITSIGSTVFAQRSRMTETPRYLIIGRTISRLSVDLVIVGAVCGLLDTGVTLLITDLYTDDRVHVDTCQLTSFNHCHWHLNTDYPTNSVKALQQPSRRQDPTRVTPPCQNT